MVKHWWKLEAFTQDPWPSSKCSQEGLHAMLYQGRGHGLGQR